MDSILTSIKKLLGIAEDYEQFDPDIIMHINTVFMTLTQQLGVGPAEGFSIESKDETWDDFIPEDFEQFAAVKTYVFQNVKLLFDPPLSSVQVEVINRSINHLEWRLTEAAQIQNGEQEGRCEDAN